MIDARESCRDGRVLDVDPHVSGLEDRLQDVGRAPPLVHRGERGQSYVYELLYETRGEGERFLARLIDVDELRCDRSGLHAERSGVGRPSVGAKSVGGRPLLNGENPANSRTDSAFSAKVSADAHVE